MPQDIEKAEDRLQNIKAVSPILGALRTISLGTWQMALNKRKVIMQYNDQLISLVPLLQTQLAKLLQKKRHKPIRSLSDNSKRHLIICIGTERGLCGRYNDNLTEFVTSHISDSFSSSELIKLGVLGSRLAHSLKRNGVTPNWVEKMPVNNIPQYKQAITLILQWLGEYEEGALESVDIVFNQQRIAGTYEPTLQRLLPPEFPKIAEDHSWPPYIIETDPLALYTNIIKQWSAIQLYNFMLEATITENLARYQLMESASQNANRLIEDLTISIQSIRRQQITRELQELAVGAGLIG